ncbi:bifunctional DNA-formamidopyrimidine glycosylase/DNA-(apurinic or apyrimidinic site) lyase [Homoserinibacter sp. YIM 151385]|uniref:bifunctional DNA-formamidopyrimidine glycosylase/DNA-(apurinic or apyrimidinic site) lyase n=1 Tax=Homoserinibacter sp. YIM 151385 TaxID=2985506 RepID=UPI0022F01DC8|nr:bifunctional DNA-formamidopyrimidine glycosylase/DNA-(apurinic or apyrimidinic site) lyase [Homoserinibacter sp. YIM 151385]WBU39192.1 bifunctional DNA-formamidopyrimidine glycosylase/DNA-(apurinic or apyrimidinic site) lyase [Homoserinibacter sp. YIM 151385]
MPELPEVEVVRAGLAPAVEGAVVESAEVLDARSLRRHEGPEEDFVERLTGARMRLPRRRGKFMWVPLEPGAAGAGAGAAAGAALGGEPSEALVVHLGMSGQVLLREPEAPRDRLTRIVIGVRHPEHGRLRVDFVDQRIFGSMALDRLLPAPGVPGDTVPGQAAHIARDPMDPAFDDARFLQALARRDTTVKRALLDQTLVSGIGNIYADEALWAARIHYEQPTRTLSRARARTLLAEVRLVLGKALAEGGTSFDAQYVNVNGASGYFSHSLNAYGRQGEPCPRCGRPIVRETFMNRGSHLCRFCQRLRAPRPRPLPA